VGARAGLHGTRRTRPDPPRHPGPRPGHGLRPRPHPPARAHPSGTQGGPAAAHARDAGQPLPHLLPSRGKRVRRPGSRGSAVGRGHGRGRDAQPPVAGGRPAGSPPPRRCWPTRSCSSPTATTATRPPGSTRTRSAGGRPPLRAHVPGVAGGPRAHRLPDPPAPGRPQGPRRPGAARRGPEGALRHRARGRGGAAPARRARRGARPARLHGQPLPHAVPAHAQGPRRGRPGPRAHAAGLPAAGHRGPRDADPHRARSGSRRTTSRTCAAWATRARTPRRWSSSARAATTPASSCARRPSPGPGGRAAGVTMPPKSTFFFPKVPTGLLFHLWADPAAEPYHGA
jgi:hypothetical protein